MGNIRWWQIIGLSGLASAIGASLLYLPGWLVTRSSVAALLVSHWPAIALVATSIYGVIACALTTTTIIAGISSARRQSEIDKAEARSISEELFPPRIRQTVRSHETAISLRSIRYRWLLRYFLWLAGVQFYTSILLLLGLALLHNPIETEFGFLATSTGSSIALAAAGVVASVGLCGAIAVRIAAALLVRVVSRLSAESHELRLLREAIDLLRRQSSPVVTPTSGDLARLSDLLERGQRSILEAIKELAISINGLGATLRQSAHDSAEAATGETATASLRVIETASTELSNTVSALAGAVGRLSEWALSLPTSPTRSASGNFFAPGPLLQVSAELQDLLREMSVSAAPEVD